MLCKKKYQEWAVKSGLIGPSPLPFFLLSPFLLLLWSLAMFAGKRIVTAHAAASPWSRAADYAHAAISTTLAVGSAAGFVWFGYTFWDFVQRACFYLPNARPLSISCYLSISLPRILHTSPPPAPPPQTSACAARR